MAMAPDEFVNRASAIHPDLGKAATKITKSKVGFAAAILITLAILKSCNFELKANIDLNRAIDQVFSKGAVASESYKRQEPKQKK